MSSNQRQIDEPPFVRAARAIALAGADVAERTGFAERIRELARRVRRAGLLFVITLAALIIFSLAVAPIPLLLWLIAIPLVGMASMLSLMWPTRRQRLAASDLPGLPGLARKARSALRAARGQMFAEARALSARIEVQLEMIESRSTNCKLDVLAESEARRLLSNHLPRLLDSYSRLPESQKNNDEIRERLCSTLIAVERELASLKSLLDQDHSDRFDTERRFFASKYGEPLST